MSETFSIVTCCNRIPTENYYCLESYLKSLRHHTPLVLTEQNSGKWSGLGSKPKWLYAAIKNKLITSKYILFTDCWDFVFTKDPNELMIAYFNLFGAPLVISAEKNCFPDDLKAEYDNLNPTTSYKYLNSGMIVGHTEALLTCLEAMDLDNVPDDYRKENGQMEHINDQFLWQQIFIKQPVKIELDYQQVLCNTLHDVNMDDLDLSKDKIRNIETGEYPLSFHFNGNAKTEGLREPILEKLNLI